MINELVENGFRLGGSRRMAEKFDSIKVTDETDWDFYGADTQENRGFLQAKGFTLVDASCRNYFDDLLIDIYKHPEQNIEVLIRARPDLYTKAFESISEDQYYKYLWKSAPHIENYVKAEFSRKVCNFFNACFVLVGMKPEDRPRYVDDLPF